MEVPLINKFQVGFEEGVKYANPKAQVFVNYAGAVIEGVMMRGPEKVAVAVRKTDGSI